MEQIFEILKLLIPATLVFFTAFYVLKQFFENEQKKRNLEARQASSKAVTPVRLQAYERMVLYLERITPDHLLMRVYKKGMSAKLLHTEMIQAIREEFEHNLAQQIYISKPSWELVKTTKEEVIKLVNLAHNQMEDDSSGLEMSKMLIKMSSELDKVPTHVAIDYIKNEVKQFF